MGCNCKDQTVGGKLRSIYDGFKHIIWKDPEIEALAKDRAKICSECNRSSGNFCKECGCYISAKVRSKIEKCPLLKWE